MHQQPRAFHVSQKFVAKTSTRVSTFDEPGNVRQHVLVVVSDVHEPKVGVLGGERVIGDLGSCPGDAAEQCGLAGIGFSDEPHVCDELQFQLNFPVFPRMPAFGFTRSPIDGICKPLVPPTTPATFGHHDGITVMGKVAEQMPMLQIAHQCSGRHQNY